MTLAKTAVVLTAALVIAFLFACIWPAFLWMVFVVASALVIVGAVALLLELS